MVFTRRAMRYAHTTGHTGLVYTENGEFVVTCGSDGDVRKWRGIEDDDPSSYCLGEFVWCITFHGNRLMASTDRNTVQAYTFPAMDKDGILMRFTATVTCLRSNGTYLCAGSDDTNIKVLKNNDLHSTLDLQGHKGPVLALDISVKDVLASIAGDGLLKVWNLADGNVVKTINGLTQSNGFEFTKCFGTPTFEPKRGESLAYVKDKEIYVLNTNTWDLQFTLSDENITTGYSCCQFSSDGLYIAAGSRSGHLSVFDFMRKEAMKCEEPGSDCEGITSIAWKPNSKTELAFCDTSGQFGMIVSQRDDANAAQKSAEDAGDVDFGDIEFEQDEASDNELHIGANDDIDDDDDGVSLEKLKNTVMQFAETANDAVSLSGNEGTRDSIPRSDHSERLEYRRASFKQQTAFQPTATPAHLEHRYLAWNSVGIVTAHTDSADGSIDVEFHDASVHHSLRIPNYNNHDMASLSTSALALSGRNTSKLVCIALAESGNKEWSVQLPDGEYVQALVATDKLVGVVSSMQFLRLFTVMGTQREVLTIPGPVVAVAGFEERLIVCFHAAPASEKQQHIGAFLVETNGLYMRAQQISLPIPAERQIVWLGFSDCGSAAFADSMGLVQLYSIKSNCWFPICDTSKQTASISNNYFIISVLERLQIIQAVLCRASSYPMTNPRPVMQELPMRLPFCEAETEKSELEDTLMRAAMLSIENADKIIKETVIKLFALACRSEIEMRAKDLIETTCCPELLALSGKYAAKLGRIHLADCLGELMEHFEQRAQRDFQAIPDVAISPHKYAGTPTSSATKLAPKTMELTYEKRLSLKRFSTLSTPLLFGSKSPANSLISQETQEYISMESEVDVTEQSDRSEAHSEQVKSRSRTLPNSMNPFAAKRKLADMDSGKKAVLMGYDRLKMMKK